MVRLTVLLAAVACNEAAPPPVEEGPPPRDWRDEVIYHLLTDRFADGTPDTDVDRGCGACWHGGDWRGLIDRLDYLEQLGVTAVWLSPVVDNADSPLGGDAYHGYWPLALDRVNPRFGTAEDLRALAAALHARDMKLVLDVVVNHMGPIGWYDVDGNQAFDGAPELTPAFDSAGRPLLFFDAAAVSPAPLRNAAAYHRRGQIGDYDDPLQALTGDFRGGLRDIDTTGAGVAEALRDATLSWIRDLGADAVRWDAVKHMQPAFWRWLLAELRAQAPGVFHFAEVFDGDAARLASWTGPDLFDGVLGFAHKFRAFDEVFASSGATARLVALHRDLDAVFALDPTGDLGLPPRETILPFLDSHDLPRFGSVASDGALRTALAFLLLGDGIPILYYGTEQGLRGGIDPANREDLWDTAYPTDGERFVWVARLNRLRRSETSLRRGGMHFVWASEHTGSESDAGIVAFERAYAAERLLGVINAAAKSSRTSYLGAAMGVGFAPGSRLTDRLGEGAPIVVDGDGTVVLDLPPFGVRVYAAEP